MSTPTPLTDEAWSSAFNAEDFSASSVALSMRVFSQKIEMELATERARLRQIETHIIRSNYYDGFAATSGAATSEVWQMHATPELSTPQSDQRASCH